ncbi:MAG TPA: dihydrofolate reductase family protein [Blastocatellia bacterium]|nr:dihydrofolate reductase family protein [Blastocatellia bacterium]
MRKVTLGLANSLDNFIARTNGTCDWLRWDEETAAISSAYLQTIDTFLIGRKTYEVMLSNGMTSYTGFRNCVFSRTLQHSDDPNVEIIAEDAAAFVRQIKGEAGKGICVYGGSELACSLFAANLIDEVVLNIHPVLLGSGIPLFYEMERQIDLELIEAKPLQQSKLLVTYRVKNGGNL